MKTINRNNLNWSNIEKLPTANDMLNNLYGKDGSIERESFKKEAYSYYTGQIIEQASKGCIAVALGRSVELTPAI